MYPEMRITKYNKFNENVEYPTNSRDVQRYLNIFSCDVKYTSRIQIENFFPFDTNSDHKISIKESYTLNIPPLEVSTDSNLCVTKRKLNSLKKTNNIEKFLKDLKNKSHI